MEKISGKIVIQALNGDKKAIQILNRLTKGA